MYRLLSCCKKVQKSEEKINTVEHELDVSASSANSSAGIGPTLGVAQKEQKSEEKMNTAEDKLEVSAGSASSSAGLGPTLSVAPPSPAQSNTDVSKYAEELIKDPTVLRSATSIGKMFKGGSNNNVTTIFAKNLIESATSDLLIEIESCSSMSSGSCESGMDMMDSVLDITGLIHAEKRRIKGECSREDLGLLSQITKFKPISRETTETHQRESTHELVHRRDSKGATTEHLHKSQSITTMADVRQGKIRTASGKTLRIRCSKTNEILRQKMIYNARQELAPPKKKKFKTIAKAIAWTMRNRLAFMKGDAPKTKEQEEEEKIQKLAKIFTTNVIKGAVKKYELEERQEAIRKERRRRANRRKFTTTANFFGELEDFPDPRPWVKKFDKNHNPNNKALAYWVREIQRQVMVHELGPPPPGLDLPCSNLSLRHSKHSDLKMACHAETEEELAIFSGRKNSSIYFADITKIRDSDTLQVREEDKLSLAVGGAPEEKTDSPRTGKESTSKPDYIGGKSGGSSVTREAKGAGMTGLFPANDVPSGKKSPKSGGILKVKDDKIKDVKSPVQKDQVSSSAVDEPIPIWTKAPKEKKSWTTQDKPRDMTDPRVDPPYILRSLTEVRPDKSVEEPPPAPRSSEKSSGPSGGTPETEAAQTKKGTRVRPTAVADSVVLYRADERVQTAVHRIMVSVAEGMMARSRYLRILNRAVSIIDPMIQVTEAELFNPTLLGELIHQVNQTYSTMEATTMGLTRIFLTILSGVLTRVAGLMPLVGATEEGGLPVLHSNAPVGRTDTATSTGNRLMATRVSPPPSVSGADDQNATKEQQRSVRRKTKLSKGQGRKEVGKVESDEKRSSRSKKSDEEPEATIWKVPDRRRRSSLNPPVVEDLKNTLQHREEERQKKKQTLHFTSQSSAASQKSTVTKYGKGKKKDTASLETSQATRKTTLAFTPPPPPPPLPGCLPGGSAPAQAAPVVYTTQTAEVGQRATVSSREQDGTEVSTETATMATMMEAQMEAPPAAPPLPPPDYYLLGGDESDDETPKEQAPPPGAARVYVPPNYLGRFQSQGFKHVEFHPSPRGSATNSVAGSDVGSVRSSRASTPAGTPRSSSPVGRDRTSQGVQSTALTTALRDVGESRGATHGMMQPRRDSLAFRLQSQATQLKHSTTVRRKTSTGETEDTAEASHMVATVQADRVPSPPPLPSFGLGLLSAHPMSMSPLSSATLGHALHDAIGRRDHAVPGHMQSSSSGNDSLSFRLQSQSTKLKHSTTVRRKTSTGETEDTAEASQMVATVQAERIPTPPPLPAFGLGAHAQIAPPAALAIPSAAPTMGLLSHSPALPIPQLGGITSLSGGTAMRHTSASSKVTQKTSVKKGDETVENVAEASQAMATTEVMQIPPPPPLPTSEQLRRPSLPRGTPHLLMHGAGFGRVPSPPTLPPMELLMAGISGGFGRVPSPPTLPPMELLMAGISGGFGRVPSPPALPPMELLMDGISGGFGRVPSPPALPPMELLMAGISGGFGRPQPNMALQMAGPSALAAPQSSLLSQGHGQGGGTFMRSTTASNKMTHKIKVTKGDETVENVAEASETVGTMEVGHIPEPPPLPTPEQLRRPSLPQATPQLNMALQMAGPSALAAPQNPASLMSPGHGQGGGTFMRSTTASNKMTHKTKVTKGDETVENVAEAGQTVATMEAGHIPAPPPLPTGEQLRRPSTLPQLPQGAPQPNMALMFAGPAGLVIPQPPPLPASLMSPGRGGGTFMRSTTASNKMTHKTKVTKGDEMVENVAEASETVGTMEVGIIPEPPPLPTPEQLRRPSLPTATPHFMMHGAGFGRVPSPPTLPPIELLLSGISDMSGRVPSPPALPPMEFLMSEIRYTSRQVPNPPALPTMEFLMSGISGSPRPLLDLVGSGSMQPVPDPTRQYTVMSMGTVEGGEAVMARKEYSQKVREALVGNDNESGSSKAQAAPSKDAKKSDLASKDVAAKMSGPDGSTKIKGPQEAGDSETKDTPKKTVLTYKVVPSKPTASAKVASASSIATSTHTSPPPKEEHAPVAGPSGQTKESTQDKKEKPILEASQKGANVPKAGPSGVQTAKLAPSKIPRAARGVDVKGKTPVMGDTPLSPRRADMQATDKKSVKQTAPSRIPRPVQDTTVKKLLVMETEALSPRRADMQGTDKPVKQTSTSPSKIPRPVQDAVVIDRTALSQRRREASIGFLTKPLPMKTAQSVKDSTDRPRTPQKESTARTAGQPRDQTRPTSHPPNAEQSTGPGTPEHRRPYGWVSSGIKKYNDDERARLDAEVDQYWGGKFSRGREKSWWNIEDPEERERARLCKDRSQTDLRRTGSSGRVPGETSASYKPPGIGKEVKYDVDRTPVMLPGHFGESTGVRSRASRPDKGLVPKKLDMEVFDSSEDSEDEVDLDKPVSVEDLRDDEYWQALEKKAYAMVKKSMEQLETVEEDETPVQEASPTAKKPSKFSQMFQSRKEKERKREREARKRAMKEEVPHKSVPPNAKPFYGPPLPPDMQKKKTGLTRHGHQEKPTLAASKAEDEESSTSKKSSGRLTPSKLVGKIKGSLTRVKDSIKSRLSGEESDSSFSSDVE
ncbi:uncharacterized protein LOC144864567 [Branchiostoma floridae x Branchiostoma japonicum]